MKDIKLIVEGKHPESLAKIFFKDNFELQAEKIKN